MYCIFINKVDNFIIAKYSRFCKFYNLRKMELSKYLPKDLINIVFEYSDPYKEAHMVKQRKINKIFKSLIRIKAYNIIDDAITSGDPYIQNLSSEIANKILTPKDVSKGIRLLKKNRKYVKNKIMGFIKNRY